MLRAIWSAAAGQGSWTRSIRQRQRRAGATTWVCEGIGRKCLAFSRNNSEATAAYSRAVNGYVGENNSVQSARTDVFTGC